MKTLSVLVLLSSVVWAAEQHEINRWLTEGTEGGMEEYVGVRSRIWELGEETLPLLGRAAVDEALRWRQRLMARILYERLTRGEEIRALVFHDWGSYPPYQDRMTPVVGPSARMYEFVLPKLKETGLWYYYIELNWRGVGGLGVAQTRRGHRGIDMRFSTEWPRWCRQALEGEPEEIYLWMAIADRIEKEEGFLESYDNRLLYAELIARRVKYAVPILLGKWEEFLENHFTPYEAFPGSRTITLRSYVSDIVAMADSTHAEALERFISQREELFGVFRSQLDEVRKRESVKVQEPPFRCEKKPPLKGMKEPPPGFFDPPKPPEPPPANTSPQDIIIHVN